MTRSFAPCLLAGLAFLLSFSPALLFAQKLTHQAIYYENGKEIFSEERYTWGDTLFYLHTTKEKIECAKLFEQAGTTILALFDQPTSKKEIHTLFSLAVFRTPRQIHTCTKEDGYPSAILHASSTLQETGEVQLTRNGNALVTKGMKTELRFDWNREELTVSEGQTNAGDTEPRWNKTSRLLLQANRAFRSSEQSTTDLFVDDSKNFVRNYIFQETFIAPVLPHFVLPFHDVFPVLSHTQDGLTWKSVLDDSGRIAERSAESGDGEEKTVNKFVFSYFK